jgi:hypothetical protein
MRTRGVELTIVALVLLSFLTLPAMGEDEVLPRSFYVPVSLELCEHVEKAVLYREDTPLRALPGEHVFQFTFYPALKRIEPEFERVRVEGRHHGEPFRAELVVTPFSVYIGNKKIDLDVAAEMKRLRRQIDVRHETVHLTLRCSASCLRRTRSAKGMQEEGETLRSP